MAYAALAVGNMSSTALYVDSFKANVYSDSAYTVLVGSQSCQAVKDATGNWVQSSMMSFPGLVRGDTYYIEAGPVSPGGVFNFSQYSVMAGTLTIPACTYGGTFSTTGSGVIYDITPASVPSDIDHFEAIWTKDGSTADNSSYENFWTGTTANGSIHLFAAATPGQEVRLFLRAISTTGGYQNWVLVDDRTVSAVPMTGAVYADGTSIDALRPAQAGADVTGSNTALDTSAVNGINSGHIADTALSVGFVGKWWRTSVGSPHPVGGGELPYSTVAVTHDAQINYNIWHYDTWAGAVIGPPWSDGLDGQYLYVRWTGFLIANTSGVYTFGTNSDDGANLYVNGVMLVNNLGTAHAAGPDLGYQYSGTISLVAGDTYEVVVEWYNGTGNAGIQAIYTPPGGSAQILNLGTAFKSAAFLRYADGQTVAALQPAQAGADITGSNTAADTNAVNGVTASAISPIAGLMPAQAGADVTSSNTAAAITGQGALATQSDLDGVPDGSTYSKVTGVSGNQATTASIQSGAVNASLSFFSSGVLFSSGTTTLATLTLPGTTVPAVVSLRTEIQFSAAISGQLASIAIFKTGTGGAPDTQLVATVNAGPLGYPNWNMPVGLEAIDTSPVAGQQYYVSVSSFYSGGSSVAWLEFIADMRKA